MRGDPGVYEKFKGSGVWWISYTEDGRNYRRKIGSIEEAREAYQLVKERIRKQRIFGPHGIASRRYAGMPQLARSAQSGAAKELIVCADLLERGYYVFRNVAAAGPDLVAVAGRKRILIEVKTGRPTARGTLAANTKADQVFHVVAMVYENQVAYDPPMPVVDAKGKPVVGEQLAEQIAEAVETA